MGVLSSEDIKAVRAMAGSPQLQGSPEYRRTQFPSYQPPRSWNSDLWYVFAGGVPSPNLNGVKAAAVPKEILEWFNKAQNSPKTEFAKEEAGDVCLGFCYDPTYWR